MAIPPKLPAFPRVARSSFAHDVECLNHQHASLQGALQVAAGIEIKRAGRFLVVMDTLVTLAPLLGLLGTITGYSMSFSFLGNEELAVQAVTRGIAGR